MLQLSQLGMPAPAPAPAPAKSKDTHLGPEVLYALSHLASNSIQQRGARIVAQRRIRPQRVCNLLRLEALHKNGSLPGRTSHEVLPWIVLQGGKGPQGVGDVLQGHQSCFAFNTQGLRMQPVCSGRSKPWCRAVLFIMKNNHPPHIRWTLASDMCPAYLPIMMCPAPEGPTCPGHTPFAEPRHVAVLCME